MYDHVYADRTDELYYLCYQYRICHFQIVKCKQIPYK
jgi:hypothetical protein